MPAVPPPPGTTPPAGAPLPDERALERVFRSHYGALTEEAKKHLKDAPSAASRVVEGLFLNAWAAREEFKTAQQLDEYLNGEVAHAAARELSRRASAHHFGGSAAHAAHTERAVDVEQSWQHIHRTLHPDAKASASALAQHTRHDTASHVAAMGKRRSYTVPMVIGVVAVAAAVGISVWLNQASREGALVAALSASGVRVHQTVAGQYAGIKLDDGTNITLAPQSKLVIPEHYGDNLRVVSLLGAAKVDIAPGLKTPFELRTANVVIDVPGGSFVVRADTSDTALVVATKQDSAVVRIGKDPKLNLHPVAAGAALRVTRGGQLSVPTADQLAEATSWADSAGTVTIAHEPLSDALEELRRWYGTHIVVLDSALLTRDVSMQAPTTSSTDAIAAVEKSANVKFEYEGQTMVFKDATPAPAKAKAKPKAKKK